MRTPWIEDARTYEASDDLAQSGLYQTDDIRDFLAKGQLFRSVVMAPKGCGKTLLIKFKRKVLDKSGTMLLPQNKLVDVNPGHAQPLQQSQVEHISGEPQFWSTLWQIAITVSVLKTRPGIEPDLFEQPVRSVFENTSLNDPFQIFAELLASSTNLYFAAFKDYHSRLLPMFSQVHHSIAVFIDNVDEFFSHHLIQQRRHGLYGQLAQEYWHNAQVGLLMAVRALSGHNPHVKIFAAIRTEAFNAKKRDLPDLANLNAHILKVSLSYQDLKSIFEQNIKAERKAMLASPDAEDVMERFFGAENIKIRHPYTGRLEHIFDYILRHTLGRPRDLMTIGNALSSIRPERRDQNQIRESVNEASSEIAQSYLGEASPHHAWFDEKSLFAQLDRNVFDNKAINDVAARYDATVYGEGGTNGELGKQALNDLRRCGLIGTVREKRLGKGRFQHFESVFDVSGRSVYAINDLPEALKFIVHPVLGSYLRGLGFPFSRHVDSVNIISPDSDWISDDGMKFILQADIVNYSKILNDPSLSEIFPHRFKSILMDARDGIEFFELVAGDNFAFADRSGYLLMRAAQEIAFELRESVFGAEIRFGLDYGVLRINKINEGNNSTDQLAADPVIQRSARLCAAGTPGAVLLLPNARDALQRYEVDWPFEKLLPSDDTVRAKYKNGHWDIGKDGESGGAHQELIKLELTNDLDLP